MLNIFFNIIISGSEIVAMLINAASDVPIGTPFSSRTCTSGIIPACDAYIGIPATTATGTAQMLLSSYKVVS